MGKKRLLLWDIDGTLISTGAAGNRAIELATAQRFGGDLEGVEIAGRTDSGIAHQILTKFGEPITEESVKSLLDLYLELLALELPRSKGRVLPGVLPLLQRAEGRPDTTLGLSDRQSPPRSPTKTRALSVVAFFRVRRVRG